MDKLNINQILNREVIENNIKQFLSGFEKNKQNLIQKRGMYIYGNPGTGKTKFITKILTDMNYDIIKYDAGDIRNKSVIETITKQNMSDTNVLSLFQKKKRQLAIIMDEIDGMNNGDKGGINSLIKLIRPKKTKKQKLEDITLIPIICIGNYHIDKKIKELMKVCEVFELKIPTLTQTELLINNLMPDVNRNISNQINTYIEGDLRKLNQMYTMYTNNKGLLNDDMFNNILKQKGYNDDTKKIIHKLINNNHDIETHNNLMNETDRTIVGLLWHENIIDVLSKIKKEESFPFYNKILENICFADYIDRITFQKQIWQFNEISSLIKTYHNNKLYHTTFSKKPKYNPTDIRFTKVLTKYSTEYNNSLFIQTLCQQLNMDKKDVYGFFIDLKLSKTNEEILQILEGLEISKLDIDRIYRFLDFFSQEESQLVSDCINDSS